MTPCFGEREATNMSGAELIVGVVFGSIPIAIKVYDRSNRVFEVFSAFKQLPSEVSILGAKLSVQRAILRNNALNLLAVITRDQEYVLEAVRRPKSTAVSLDLAMAPVYRRRIDDLPMSFESCAQTAEHIRNSIHVLFSESDIHRAEVGDKQDVGTRMKSRQTNNG
ncbi:hypothetical protein FALBO_16963 [Fusarium albosuccineum]|uniref:Uncharacterized protein n=1 Tax=Fusarium albosuccineum TaxID=1237068 RepID=A0A8H4KE03_9HYPO|nr:hypothetical protein FALBO_16963 [Fusarium albosuccineum]